VVLMFTGDGMSDFLLGCTYAAGVLSSGTAFTSRGLTLDMGNDVQFIPTLNGESVDIVNRDASGQMTLDLTAAQEVTMIGEIDANTTTSIGFTVGTTTGYKVMMFVAAAQRINPKYTDVSGRLMLGMDLRVVPVSGNDELTIICL